MENSVSEHLENKFTTNLTRDLVSINVEGTQSISKGYLYASENKETKMNENYTLEISDYELIQDLNLQMNRTILLKDNEKYLLENTYYKETKLNKLQMLYLLGEDFCIQVWNQNGELLQTITKDTEVNSQGDIIISYPEETSVVRFIFSKPQSIGQIKISNKKVIKSSELYSNQTVQKMNYLETNAVLVTNWNKKEIKYITEMLEPTEKMSLELSRKEFSSAVENKKVELKITLQTKDETDALYRNPSIKIQLPKQFEKIDVSSIKLLYEDELKIEKAGLRNNVIELQLKGEQTKYKDGMVNGATIVINMDVDINNKTVNAKEEIQLICENEQLNGTYNYNMVANEISIITPQEVIVTNNIKEFGMETIGEGEENITLERNANQKQATVGMEIINNEADIKDVSILGRMPTKGNVTLENQNKENTIPINVTQPIELKAVEDINYQIYYSENPNATEDLSKTENGWKQEFIAEENISSYLIVVDNLKKGQEIEASYPFIIPANLDYNEQAYEGYTVKYTKVDTEQNSEITSHTIGLQTGNGPVITATAEAYIQDQL